MYAQSPLHFPRHLPPKRQHGWTAPLALLLVFLLGLVALCYVWQVNVTAVRGYDISALERRLEELKEEERKLELRATELQSVRTIEEAIPKLNLIPARKVIFTSPIAKGGVAQARGGAGARAGKNTF
jgi:cell division protein FtsB